MVRIELVTTEKSAEIFFAIEVSFKLSISAKSTNTRSSSYMIRWLPSLTSSALKVF